MKTPSLMALIVAGALTLPALAQDSSSQPQTPPASQPAASSTQSSSSQPAAQSQAQPTTSSTPAASTSDQSTSAQSTSAQPAAAADNSATQQQADQNANKAAQLQPLSTQRHEGFWGHLNPFARKKYVQRQIQPMQDRLNELDELTASNSKLVKDVDARATQGIQLASTRANEADQHALDAGNRAQLATQTATDANNRLTNVSKAVSNIDQYQTSSQVEIRFRPGQQALSKKAKDALDQMATSLKDQKGYIIEVQGFSAGRGQAAIQSSQLMADAVARHLVIEDSVPVYRIYKVGMGNAPLPAAENGKPQRVKGGRVEISLLKNGVGDLEPSQASATGGNSGNLPQSDQSYSGAKVQPDAQKPAAPAQPQQQNPQQPQ